MEVKLDVSLVFPIVFGEKQYDQLVKFCGSVEDVEQNFKIEFSCGDGKYFSDFWNQSEDGSVYANFHTQEQYEDVYKYDGQVCTNSPPRFNVIKMSMVPEPMKPHTIYRFTVKYYPKNQEAVYYINNKERSRGWVG